MKPTISQRIELLKEQLNIVGHRAYSRDNITTVAAAKDFERIERLKARLKKLKELQGTK